MLLRSALLALALLALPAATAQATRYGDLDFPRDEHQHVDGWDFWWGAANLVTESGHRYTVAIDFDTYAGYAGTSHELFPMQGPYKGLTVTSMDGSPGWGHPDEPPGRFAQRFSVYAPRAGELLDNQTLDAFDHLRQIGLWRRTSRDRESYHLRIDDSQARVHPTGKRVKLVVDLDADMKSPPLLAGGSGRWWYALPQTYKYPSRSFQYVQAAKKLTGTLELQQPDGSLLRERVAPAESTIEMVHEYDASPEDLFAGLAVAESTQLHPRYAQYYQGGMPWELIFLDLKNGAQLMLAVLAFHDTPDGTLRPVVGPDQPTYAALATLRLPSGRSLPLNDIHVEHLSYRTIVGIVPTFDVYVDGVWKQSWDYRVTYPGGTVRGVRVPPFDLGVLPEIGKDEPKLDDRGQGLTQRVPFHADGSWDGCPVHGFGWSELIINWYGHEKQDPWFSGGSPPKVPGHCGEALPPPPSGTLGNLNPPPDKTPPHIQPDTGCTASESTPSCSYVAKAAAGIGGYSGEPGGWTVTITRLGESQPIVVKSFGGQQMYDCGTVRQGDHVVATAKAGAEVMVGNPGICF